MRQIIRLTENELHRVVKESVNRIISEITVGKLWDCRDKNIREIEDEEVLEYYKKQIEDVRRLYPIWCKKHGLTDRTEELISKIESDNGPFYRNGGTVVERYLPFGFRDFCWYNYKLFF